MKKLRRYRSCLLIVALLLLLTDAFGVWLRAQRHQRLLDSQLIDALQEDDPGRARGLVNRGADPNAPAIPSPAPSFRQQVYQLLRFSRPAEDRSFTAFMLACEALPNDSAAGEPDDDTRLITTMLAHGADVNARTREGFSPLTMAIMLHDLDLAQLLLEHGAEVNSPGRTGEPPLMLAATTEEPDTVRLLLQHGADVNARDATGLTPLMSAAASDAALPRLLFQQGANLIGDNGDVPAGTPALNAAQSAGVVRLLLQYGANVNATDKCGDTALHMLMQETVGAKLQPADIHGLMTTARLLLAHGADLTLRDRSGRTAITMAQQGGCTGLLALVRGGPRHNDFPIRPHTLREPSSMKAALSSFQ